MTVVHHTAIRVHDVEASLRFWSEGLGFEVLMDKTFEGDWPTLLDARSNSLRSIFLGRPDRPDSGIVELVDLGSGGVFRARTPDPVYGIPPGFDNDGSRFHPGKARVTRPRRRSAPDQCVGRGNVHRR